MKTQKFGPFKWPWAVSRFHCQKCGEIREIDIKAVKQFLQVMATLGNLPEVSITKEEDWKNYYFQLPYCDNCKTPDDKAPADLKLKLIKKEQS